MNFNNKFKTLQHIKYEVESELGKRILIIPNDSGVPDMKNVLCLADTSLEIWEMIIKNFTYEQIISSLYNKYYKEEVELINDLDGFLSELIDKRYISIV